MLAIEIKLHISIAHFPNVYSFYIVWYHPAGKKKNLKILIDPKNIIWKFHIITCKWFIWQYCSSIRDSSYSLYFFFLIHSPQFWLKGQTVMFKISPRCLCYCKSLEINVSWNSSGIWNILLDTDNIQYMWPKWHLGYVHKPTAASGGDLSCEESCNPSPARSPAHISVMFCCRSFPTVLHGVVLVRRYTCIRRYHFGFLCTWLSYSL